MNPRRTPVRIGLAAFALLASVACDGDDKRPPLTPVAASTNMHAATNPAASFDAYRSFSFGSAEGARGGYPMPARSVEVQRRLQPLIAAMLTQKGYVPATGKGDLSIQFGSGLRDVSSPETRDLAGGWLPDDENADFVEGSLVIDAFDGAGGNRVWHGAMRANINPDRIDDVQLQRSVQDLLSLFPEPKASAASGP